jgi:SAM-dependent methyltransferase
MRARDRAPAGGRGRRSRALSASGGDWRLEIALEALPEAEDDYRSRTMDRTARCLLCDGEAIALTYPYGTHWNGRDFDYRRCRRCGASVLDPLPADADFELMYRATDYHDAFYEDLNEPTPTALASVARKLKPGGRILDFGCGNGAFMATAAAAGFASTGVELDPETRARASSNSGCAVSSLEEIEAAGARFDAIHLGDVLEHLPDSAGMMARLRPLLAEDGLFFVEGPLEDNASPVYYASRLFGAAKKALGRKLRGSYPPYHLYRTGAAAQRRFFEERLGWTVTDFRVFETGWPYLNPGDSLLRPGSAGKLARMAIGGSARAVAAAARPLHLLVGNRFAALVRPPS